MLKIFGLVAAALTMLVVAARWVGADRWTARTRDLRTALDAARRPVRPLVVDFAELDGLPAPVQRFFRAVLTEGQPLVAGARLQHIGTFNMGETSDQWKTFSSDQKVVTHRPGFDWDGHIAMLPGLPVQVHDAYVAGDGVLQASLLGLWAVADLRGSGDIAAGELMRFLAEAAWYPTALLPSQGVRWAGPDLDTGLGLDDDERSATATMTDGPISVTLRFTFHTDGPVETVYAEARARTLGGTLVPTPWQGRFWNYEQRGDMRVPLDGEVAWLLPAGAKPYWRGHVADIAFEFAR